MFEKFFKLKAFGLDLSGPIIRVAQLPDKFASGANIKEAMRKADIKTKYVHASLPEQECFVKLAPRDHDIKKEIESNIPLPIREVYYDYQITNQELFIVAAKKKAVDEQVALLKKAGLIIKSLEPESIAMARALVKTKDALMIIRLDNKQANFIICANKIVRFTATGSLAQAQEYIDFYQMHNGGIMKIIICGHGDLEQAAKKLKKLNLLIQIAKNPSYTTAIGLALKHD